jgi:hypothetical protein
LRHKLTLHLSNLISKLLLRDQESASAKQIESLGDRIKREAARKEMLEKLQSNDAQEALKYLVGLCLKRLGFDKIRADIRREAPPGFRTLGKFYINIDFAPKKTCSLQVVYGHIDRDVVFRYEKSLDIKIDSVESVDSVTSFLQEKIQAAWEAP